MPADTAPATPFARVLAAVRRMHDLTLQDQADSPDYEAAMAAMTADWTALTPADQSRANALSSRLSAEADAAPAGRR